MTDTATTVNPRLAELLESGGLDLDDEKQRVMFLKTWAAGVFSLVKPVVPCGPVRRDA